MAISVVIGTYNSSRYLREVLHHVKDFDEIIVYDTGSTDNTTEIAEEEGCRVISTPRDPDDTSHHHNTAIQSASSDWVLLIRPNELVPEGLLRYLEDFTRNPGETRGLFVPRRNFLMDRELTEAYPDFRLRFFLRAGTIWCEDEDSGGLPSVCGAIDRIPAHRKELSLVRLPKPIEETVGHLEESCGNLITGYRKISLQHIVYATTGAFMREYILKGKIRYGTAGYIDAVNAAMKAFYIHARRHEAYIKGKNKNRLK